MDPVREENLWGPTNVSLWERYSLSRGYYPWRSAAVEGAGCGLRSGGKLTRGGLLWMVINEGDKNENGWVIIANTLTCPWHYFIQF